MLPLTPATRQHAINVTLSPRNEKLHVTPTQQLQNLIVTAHNAADLATSSCKDKACHAGQQRSSSSSSLISQNYRYYTICMAFVGPARSSTFSQQILSNVPQNVTNELNVWWHHLAAIQASPSQAACLPKPSALLLREDTPG